MEARSTSVLEIVDVERAEKLARALKVHPAVLLWPSGWDTSVESKRAGP